MPDKIKQAYEAVKDTKLFLDESDFRSQIGRSPKDVFNAVSNTGMFLDYSDFETQLDLKKKGGFSGGGVSASASAIGSTVSAPDGNPQTQQRINEITKYLQNRNQKPVQDNLVPVQQIKTSVGATASKEKQAQEQAITQQLQQKKKVLSNSTTSGEALQAKYGADWQKKATPKELADYGQGLQDYYDKEKEKGTPMMENIPVDKGQEAIQKAADELNGTAFGKLFYNVIQPISKAGGSALSNTAAAVTRYGGRVFGLDEVTEGMADWVNENINPENRWQGTMAGSQPTKLQGNLFNNGKINLAKILPSTIETLTTMAWLTGGGSGSGQLMGRSFALTEQDYRNDGQAHGLKGAALDKFALSSAVLTSALEMISPNRLITGGEKKAFSKMYGKAIAEGFSNSAAIKLAAKEFKSEIVKENVQEISQMAGDKIVRLITDKTSDKPVFADDLSFNGIKDELAETVLMTTLSTGLLQSPNTIKNAKPSNLEKSTWYNVSQNPDQYKTFLNKQIVEGKLNKEQATNAFNFFNKYKTAVDQAKQFGFSPDQQTEAAWQIYKGNDINESILKLKNNPVLKTAVAPQLKKEQEEVTQNIQRIGMGVPEVGAEITGQDLAQIIGNIGDKGGTGENLQKRVEENTYRVEEINLQELYDNKESFRNNVDNYDRKEDESGLIVPAIMNTEGKIIDGRSRLAQQYKNGQKTAHVFKQLKTEADIEPISEAVEPNNVDNSQQPQAASVENKPQQIRQLGTGANVYFETDKYRVNDYKKGKVLLNVGEENGLTPLANVEFDDVNEAVFVAKKLNENSPKGLVADYHNVDKIIANFKEEYKAQANAEPSPNIRQQTEFSADNLQEIKPEEIKIEQQDNTESKVKEIESERDAEIDKIIKPSLKMSFVSSNELVNTKDPLASKEKHDEIKDKYKKIKQLLECL